MNKVKVLHCFGTLNVGGAETLIFNIQKRINKEKFQFDFVVFNKKNGFYDNDFRSLGSHIFVLPSLSEIGIVEFTKKLFEFFENYKPDIVHSHMDWQGGFIAYAANKARVKKIIIHSHADQRMFMNDIVHKLGVSISKFLIHKYATNRLACSNIAGQSLFNKDSFNILFNGVDIERFENPDYNLVNKLKKEFCVLRDDIILGTVGSLTKNKNQKFLIQLLSKLRKKDQRYKLFLVGEGTERETLEKLAKDLNVEKSVFFVGVRTDIPELLNLFSLFLFPSRCEGLGISVIEAQVSGTKCILSNNIPEQVVIDQDLVSFLPLDICEWEKVISKSILVYKKKKVNRKLDEFDISNTIDQLENLYLSQ